MGPAAAAQAQFHHAQPMTALRPRGPGCAIGPPLSIKCHNLSLRRVRSRSGKLQGVQAVYAADSSSSSFGTGDTAHVAQSASSPVEVAGQSEERPRLLGWLASQEEEEYVLNAVGNVGVLAFAGAALVAHVASNDASLWEMYQQAVTTSPVATKAAISGVVYSLGDIMAQSYEGRSVAEWDRARVIRSGLCGLLAHGPLSHYYYLALDSWFAHMPVPSGEWVTPLLKMGVDQTAWSLFWNTTYYVLLGALKLESPSTVAQTVKNTWWDLLKAGWRLWPFVHIVTYGLLPVQHRLLFVDAVELVWVTILSVYGQQQRKHLQWGDSVGPVACALPGGDGEGGDFAEEILRGMQVEREIVFEDQYGHRSAVEPGDVFGSDVYVPHPVPVVADHQKHLERERS